MIKQSEGVGFRRRRAQVGAAPGSFTPPTEVVEPMVRVMTWNVDELEEREIEVEDLGREHPVDGRLRWVDVQGLGDGTEISKLVDSHGLHPLAVADVVNIGQRPKAESYGEEWFLVLRMAGLEGESLSFEQISLFLLDGMVISFQERPGDCLEPLRERIRRGGKRLRANGSEYLAVMILDAIVDGYFPVLEQFGEILEDLETTVVARPTTEVLERIYAIKRELLTFRRSVWPLRETLSQLIRDEALSDEVHPYLRDVTDHVSQVSDIVETYREISASFVDVYLSSVSQRTNETMRVLTVIATIFIPLTFVAGVYGMNFDTSLPGNLPELALPYGYFIFWGVCALMGVGLVFLFRHLGWLGGGDES